MGGQQLQPDEDGEVIEMLTSCDTEWGAIRLCSPDRACTYISFISIRKLALLVPFEA